MLSSLSSLLVLVSVALTASAARSPTDRRSHHHHLAPHARSDVNSTGDSIVRRAGTWGLKETIIGQGFLNAFTFETADDPTHGTVDYVDAATAASLGLTQVTGSSFILRAESKTIVPANARGRKSVRLASKKTYTNGVIIMDLKHMPTGCGTWPAFWTVQEAGWPAGGEIDIIERVNNDVDNLSSLHTSAGCDMPANRDMRNPAVSLKCGSSNGDNTGCGVSYKAQPNSFGAAFNRAGGGIYAMSRTPDAIKTWFWPVGTAPADVRSGAATVNEATWGKPSAIFPSTNQCSVGAKMAAHQMIINLTFCGDWAGLQANYAAAGCPGTCADNARNNPWGFTEAYFEINSIRTYASSVYFLSARDQTPETFLSHSS